LISTKNNQNLSLCLVSESIGAICTCLINPLDGEELEMAGHRGGKGNFAEDPQRASEAGKKGGHVSGGNFKNDPERASEAGRKGGQSSGGGRSS